MCFCALVYIQYTFSMEAWLHNCGWLYNLSPCDRSFIQRWVIFFWPTASHYTNFSGILSEEDSSNKITNITLFCCSQIQTSRQSSMQSCRQSSRCVACRGHEFNLSLCQNIVYNEGWSLGSTPPGGILFIGRGMKPWFLCSE